MDTILIFSALQALCGLVIYFLLKRFFTRWFSRTGQLENVQAEVEKMLVDLNHTTSGNIDLIEERIGSLKELLQGVDKRISLLKREAEKTETGNSLYSSILKKPMAERPVVDTQDRVEISMPPPVRKPEPLPRRPAPVMERSEIKDRVIELYNSGFSLAVIANQVGTSVGEVELIVSLTEKK